jgi:hypothetical protein
MLYILILTYKRLMLSSAHFGTILSALAINLAVNIGWFLYFKTSLRVRNTFGRNL